MPQYRVTKSIVMEADSFADARDSVKLQVIPSLKWRPIPNSRQEDVKELLKVPVSVTLRGVVNVECDHTTPGETVLARAQDEVQIPDGFQIVDANFVNLEHSYGGDR